MDGANCHASGSETAKGLILKALGVRRVADWCDVSEAAVYQWLSRGTAEHPIPPRYVGKILTGARKAGIAVDASVLWPELAA